MFNTVAPAIVSCVAGPGRRSSNNRHRLENALKGEISWRTVVLPFGGSRKRPELKDKRFSSAPRFGFRDEVLIRYATHPIDILVIPDQWAGSKAMTQAFERLKAKSA